MSALRSAVRAEWVKFRTVRGWVVAVVASVVFCVLFTLLVANGNQSGTCVGNGVCTTGHAYVPTGPAGEAVADSYQYLERPLTGSGTLTARVVSLTGRVSTSPADVAPSIAASRASLADWAKAGILLTSRTSQGSPYAAVLATGGHGVHFQYDYTHDQAGLPGPVADGSSRWVRLTRRADTITGYASMDGVTWRQVGRADLMGLPATVMVGFFVTSPVTDQATLGEVPSQATATFDGITLDGHTVRSGWQSRTIGADDYYPKLGSGRALVSRNGVVLSGSGDVATAVNLSTLGGNSASGSILFGAVIALMVLLVVATLFMTAEYRRGLIRATFTAVPQRGSVLGAKAVVVGAAAFAAGVVATAVAVPLGVHVLTTGGNYVFPANAVAMAQIVVGTGALFAITAVGVLALGAIVRTGAGAVAASFVVFALPNLLGPGVLGSGGTNSLTTWLYRITPAAGFSVLGTLPRSTAVSLPYTLSNGYYPLPPWAGLMVLCSYAAVAVAWAAFLLRRRDA